MKMSKSSARRLPQRWIREPLQSKKLITCSTHDFLSVGLMINFNFLLLNDTLRILLNDKLIFSASLYTNHRHKLLLKYTRWTEIEQLQYDSCKARRIIIGSVICFTIRLYKHQK